MSVPVQIANDLVVNTSTPNEHNPTTNLNPVSYYLTRIGLNHNPFELAVAERELRASFDFRFVQTVGPQKISQSNPFFEYFIPTPLKDQNRKELFPQLRREVHTFLFGKSGSGKTMLSLALHADLRLVPERTLATSISLSDISRMGLWLALQRSLAVDAFIQFIEQFNPFNPSPTPSQEQALIELILAGDILRLARRLLEEDHSDNLVGQGILWAAVNRPAVRYVSIPEELRILLRQLLPKANDRLIKTRQNRSDSLESFSSILSSARILGFERIFLIMDEFEDLQVSRIAIGGNFDLLFLNLAALEIYKVYLKCFLPIEYRDIIQRNLDQTNLSFSVFNAIIDWNDADLAEILWKRFQAAGSWRHSMNGIAGEGLQGILEQVLIRSANGSPRRLLQLVNALIEAHANRDKKDPYLNAADWEQMRRNWHFGLPLPLSLSNTNEK